MRVYICMYLYIGLHVCMYLCVCVCLYIGICLYMCVCVYIYIFRHSCVCVWYAGSVSSTEDCYLNIFTSLSHSAMLHVFQLLSSLFSSLSFSPGEKRPRLPASCCEAIMDLVVCTKFDYSCLNTRLNKSAHTVDRYLCQKWPTELGTRPLCNLSEEQICEEQVPTVLRSFGSF